jgi:L-iditol 2-dehydrogenase
METPPVSTVNKSDSKANGIFQPERPNPALFTNEKREIFMSESPALRPKPDECVVRMRCNGICG